MKAGAVRKLSGAELRALRDQRAAADPAAEAWAHESSFLRSLATAEEDFNWIVEHEAWTLLGHDTFSAWWDTRAPRMSVLGFQPTRQIALAALARLRADDEKLPKAQRRTSRQLAASVGLPESTMRRVSPRSLPAPNGAAADLGKLADAAFQDPATDHRAGWLSHCEKCGDPLRGPQVEAGDRRCAGCDVSRLHRTVQVDGEFVDDRCDECERIARLAAASEDSPAADDLAPPSPQQPGQDSPTGPDDDHQEAVVSSPGDVRSETDHHLPGVSGGEAREDGPVLAEPEKLEGGGSLPPESPSSSDPEELDEEMPATARLLRLVGALVVELDFFDIDSLAAELYDAELERLHGYADMLAEFVGRIDNARTP